MQPPPQHSWINLAELKSQIIRKIGPDRSKQYFDYLNKFLSLKLSKVEFDKLCLRTIGKDGILLHNQLIRSILSNACSTVKAPVENKKVLDGGYHQNGPDSIVTNASSQPVLPNGDILLTSPRKARTGARERRVGDRKSVLGPNGKTVYSSPSSSIPHLDEFNTNLDNGNSLSPDTRRPMQHHQELTQQAQNADNRAKSLHAPLGIPYYPVSIGGARKAPPVKSVSVSDINGLLDTVTLRARMEPISVAQGLQGVSPDSANVLNNGLDVYLKGLIRSCSELNRPRKSNPAHNRPVNGVIPGHQYQTQEHERKHRISLLDFRVAMELNPQQLGEDWPVLLEKIRTPAFEE
ncbi:putative transcriptional coactivator Hfi1/Transcriptional adapter 1 [Helianthus debilis subsp. tardiflorus]